MTLRTLIDNEPKSYWDFKADIRVWDPRQLHAAACERYREENGDAANVDTVELLGTADNPNISACLIMLLDPGSLPGCSIEESTAKEWE